MHLLLMRIVATILADQGADAEQARELLSPIDDQDRRLAAIYAARRRGQSTGAVDIDATAAADVAREAEAEALAEGLLADEAALDAEVEAEDAVDVALDAPENDPPTVRPIVRD